MCVTRQLPYRPADIHAVYANAVLVTLNSRKIIRDVGLGSETSMPKPPYIIGPRRWNSCKTDTVDAAVIHLGGEMAMNGVPSLETASTGAIHSQEGDGYNNCDRV